MEAEGLVVIGISGILVPVAQIIQDFRVKDRRADFIDIHSPLAQVNLAATVAAKGKVLIRGMHRQATSGTVKNLYGFFSGTHRGYIPAQGQQSIPYYGTKPRRSSLRPD
jgi:hypothetical protein